MTKEMFAASPPLRAPRKAESASGSASRFSRHAKRLGGPPGTLAGAWSVVAPEDGAVGRPGGMHTRRRGRLAWSGSGAREAAAKAPASERAGSGEAASWPLADLAGRDDSGEELGAATAGGAGAGRLEDMSFEAEDAPQALASAGTIFIATSEHDAIL